MTLKRNVTNARSLLAAGLLTVGLLVLPTVAQAQEEIICTVVYGQGEVCGVKTPEEMVLGVHEPIEAGIEDINFAVLAASLGAAGAIFFLISKLTRRVYLLDH